MNAIEDIYDYHMGARQGSTSSKEQYGFIWNRNKFTMHAEYDYNDVNSWFERPPTVVFFDTINPNTIVKKFFVISTHVKPETGSGNMLTEDEINHLEDVYNDAISQYPEYQDGIIAGDMNADCTYVADPEGTLSMFTDANFNWLLDFSVDTTVSATNCAYDHIVLRGPNMASAFHGAQVFDYQTFYDTDNIFYDGEPITDLISDHFPVEVSFN